MQVWRRTSDPALGQQIFRIAEAETETMVQPGVPVRAHPF